MDVLRIHGGRRLQGTVPINGAKNAALPIMAAALLTDEPVTLTNVPDLSDVRFMGEIIGHVGADVERLGKNSWRIQTKTLDHVAPYELVRKMRASVCLLGPMVTRVRRARVSMPGGCVIGPRPIDLHLKGLRGLGCRIDISAGYIDVDASGLRGGYVFLGGRHGSTVTGTANIIMAAVLAPGTTRLESAAVEPEVVDLCNMLVKMGAQIEGVGSHYLKIHGVDKLHGCEHSVIPDRIEAGTFLVAGAITGGDVTVTGVVPGHMRSLLDKLEECGVALAPEPDTGKIRVIGSSQRRAVDIVTMAHPGFPTDLQAQMCALMALTPGLSIITERIYPNRYMHVPELGRMGADIAIEGANAIVHGKEKLSGAPVMASDLRASAALLIAGMAAEGDTWVQRVYHIDRGYEKIEERLAVLGAEIHRLPDTEMPRDLLEE